MSCYTAFRSPYSLIQDRNNLHDVSSGRTPQAPNITKLRGSSVKRLALFIEDKVTIDTFSFNIDSKTRHLDLIPVRTRPAAVLLGWARARRVPRERPDTQRNGFWQLQRPRYLLSSLMKCGQCGASYTKYGLHRFGCSAARDRATCTNHLTIHGGEIEAAILAGLKQRLMEPALFEAFAREFTAEVNRQRSALASEKKTLQGELARVTKRTGSAPVASSSLSYASLSPPERRTSCTRRSSSTTFLPSWVSIPFSS
jgi:hypothetical protein